MKKEDLQRWLLFVKGEALTAKDAFRERGAKYFSRPLVLGGVLVLASYWYLYAPSANRLIQLKLDVQTAKSISQYAEDYQNLKTRLAVLQSKLPTEDKPDSWLLEAVRRSLREEGIVPLMTSSPTEVVGQVYRVFSIKVRCQANYAQMASWVSRLERGKHLLLIKDLKLKKDTKPIGSNTAEVTIVTLVPRDRGS